MTTQFDSIYLGLAPEPGKFRVAASGMAWKGESVEKPFGISATDIKWAQWLRVARNFQLRVGIKDRKKISFDGFARDDHDKLASLLKQHFNTVLETKDVIFKGWNWGVTDFQGQDLAFMVSNKLLFELPLSDVANSNIAGKTEVSLEFNTTESTGKKVSKSAPDEMVEMRFYVPGSHVRKSGSDAGGSQKSDAEEDDETSAAQAFHDAVKDKAEIGQVTGDIILSFDELPVTTPRGRYDVDMFPDFLRLRGKTYDYKILYSSISKLFLLPKDEQHVFFIVGLSTPIRQGLTRYHYLVTTFSREEEITAELNMSEEEVATYDRLKKNYEDPTYEVVSSVFRALAKKKIIGAGGFQGRDGSHPGIKANLKAVQGDLFMLEKYIFFVSKQPTLIELADIHQAVFSRVGVSMGAAAARTFDLKIITKSGPEYNFTSIEKDDHSATEEYMKEKKIRTKNEMVADMSAVPAGVDDDEEMMSVASSGDEAPQARGGGMDDEDSEDDLDFKASGSDSGSPSGSDNSDDAATASDASGDRDIAKAGKPKKKKLTKKEGSPKASGKDAAAKPKKAKKPKADDAMDIDEPSGSKLKPKPKPKKKDGDEEGPPKKKQKASASD